jgi:hypothetical protein
MSVSDLWKTDEIDIYQLIAIFTKTLCKWFLHSANFLLPNRANFLLPIPHSKPKAFRMSNEYNRAHLLITSANLGLCDFDRPNVLNRS